jgi:hypothetical protein
LEEKDVEFRTCMEAVPEENPVLRRSGGRDKYLQERPLCVLLHSTCGTIEECKINLPVIFMIEGFIFILADYSA